MTPTSPASPGPRKNLLSQLKIASPCHARWEDMVGSEQVRFCGQCSLHVYNLSAMNDREAEDLVMKTEGRLCVRMLKRHDGTVITQDCPRGLAAVRRKMQVMAGALAGLIAALTGWDLQRSQCAPHATTGGAQVPAGVRYAPPLRPMMGEAVAPEHAVMGKMAAPQHVEVKGDVAFPPGFRHR